MENKTYSFSCDVAVDIIPGNDRDLMIDRYGDNEEEHFLAALNKYKVEYDILSEDEGSGWPLIEFTGTLESLSNIMVLLSTTSQTQEEIMDILNDWDGEDEDYLLNHILG